MAGVFEEVAAFLRLKTVEGLTDELPETLAGPLGGFAQRRLEFGEGLLDRIEVWAVGRQIDEGRALRSDRLDDVGLAGSSDCRA
jgi:hypothetical protein